MKSVNTLILAVALGLAAAAPAARADDAPDTALMGVASLLDQDRYAEAAKELDGYVATYPEDLTLRRLRSASHLAAAIQGTSAEVF